MHPTQALPATHLDRKIDVKGADAGEEGRVALHGTRHLRTKENNGNTCGSAGARSAAGGLGSCRRCALLPAAAGWVAHAWRLLAAVGWDGTTCTARAHEDWAPGGLAHSC